MSASLYTVGIFRRECDIPSTWHRVDTVEVCGMNVYVNVCLITDCVVGPGREREVSCVWMLKVRATLRKDRREIKKKA